MRPITATPSAASASASAIVVARQEARVGEELEVCDHLR